jgi:predicted PurR-regulated permease PerM
VGEPMRAPDNRLRDPEERLREVVEAASAGKRDRSVGRPGKALNRRSPFFIGLSAAAGVAVAYGIVELIVKARSVLVLIGLALFIAAGLDPLVTWLCKKGLPRWAAVLTVVLALLALGGGFIAAAVPPLAGQTAALLHDLPHYVRELKDHNSQLGRLNARYHLQQHFSSLLSSKGTTLIGGVIGAGAMVLSVVSSLILVAVLTVYFLISMERTKLFAYRLIPQSRRDRVVVLGEEIFTKVGGYVLGNVITSLIAGVGTFIWSLALGIPYPLLLGVAVAILDLVPVIGSTIGGVIVTIVALTVSVPIAIGTLVFYIAYRLAEDYLLVPKIIGRTVEVPAIVSLIAVVIGGVLLGIVGALVAIPAAAAISLLLHEVTFPRQDNS